MQILYDVSPTIRSQMKHHEPIVLLPEEDDDREAGL